MRRRLPSLPFGLPAGQARGEPCTIDFEGQPVRAFAGQPIAAALWAAGTRVLVRSPKYHRPRGMFCLTGHCGGCALRIAGEPNVRACLTAARPGLRCERQNAFPDAELDVLRMADWLFPGGMDHHHLMTSTRLGNRLFVELVRRVGGAGTLPDEPEPPATPPPAAVRDRAVDVCVVGGGPAGIGAALAIADHGPALQVMLIDEQLTPGGSWLAEPRPDPALAELVARQGQVELLSPAAAIGFFSEDTVDPDTPVPVGCPRAGVLAVHAHGAVFKLTARAMIFATGAYDQNLIFPGNDRPGLLSARACGRLAFAHGVVPARKVTLIEDPGGPAWDYLDRLAAGLAELGIRVVRTGATDATPPRTGSSAWAIGGRPAPAFELARQAGAEVRFSDDTGVFHVVAAADGATRAPRIFAAGDATGYQGPARAFAHGQTVGRAVAARLRGTPA